jgi:serine/threonine protein kinase
LLHGRTPWEAANERELVDKMLKQAPTMSRDLSDDVKDFLRKCFLTDESKRLGLN